MPRYRSIYDPNPLPDPGNGSPETAEPAQAALSKSLVVNWSAPQPLHTVTPSTGGGSADDDLTGSGGKGDGKGGGGDDVNPLAGVPTGSQLKQQLRQSHGPDYESVRVRPEDLLEHEQRLLDSAKVLAQTFNALVVDSEAKLGADFWGTEEGVNQTQHRVPGQNPQQADIAGAIDNSPHYTYTPSALSTRKFLESLRMNQRTALQHVADTVTISGGYIELLNASADAYASGDQYSVFPDKSSVSKGQG
ncbi:hypothetical protein BDK92_3758 [Micromonospora pisi]|uniref:Uncharacterized protein n=1 Tax=Micromonospora pisi TaxID=589240 RepID=A0A495JM43_9ACTN|nr:hypothetical protein [Micromonospora pisi]RKR89412.1 hypothetical protein BDK92_3758 [Micromonospora pisi]